MRTVLVKVTGGHRVEGKLKDLLGRDPEIHSGMAGKGKFCARPTLEELDKMLRAGFRAKALSDEAAPVVHGTNWREYGVDEAKGCLDARPPADKAAAKEYMAGYSSLCRWDLVIDNSPPPPRIIARRVDIDKWKDRHRD